MAEPPEAPEKKPGDSDNRGLAMLSTVVAEMVIAVILGVWFDRRYGSEPWGALVGAVVGIGGGVMHLMYIGRRSAGGKPPTAGKDS
jgi:F0F1-type ATP synthase assembly protein I